MWDSITGKVCVDTAPFFGLDKYNHVPLSCFIGLKQFAVGQSVHMNQRTEGFLRAYSGGTCASRKVGPYSCRQYINIHHDYSSQQYSVIRLR